MAATAIPFSATLPTAPTATIERAPSGGTNLCTLATADRARISRLETPTDDVARLKSLGLCVGRRVEVVKRGDPLIVRVLGARVGLSARLAATVFVEHCTD